MKTFSIFLLILCTSLISYTQTTTTASQNTKTSTAGIIANVQSFTIQKIYPNPLKDFITIELRTEVSGTVVVSLFNILGTEVKKWDKFFLNQGDQKLKLDLSQFKNGVYILKITKEDQVRTQVLKKN
jgi:hypothetical protein